MVGETGHLVSHLSRFSPNDMRPIVKVKPKITFKTMSVRGKRVTDALRSGHPAPLVRKAAAPHWMLQTTHEVRGLFTDSWNRYFTIMALVY